jgi:hypothetical protein
MADQKRKKTPPELRSGGNGEPPRAGPYRPSWRFRMLLLALDSETSDGSDLSDSDRRILVLLDRYLGEREAREGAETADQVLHGLVKLLEAGESLEGVITRH